MKKPIYFLISVLIFGFGIGLGNIGLINQTVAQAQDSIAGAYITPSVFVTNFELDSMDKKPGGSLEGRFTVLNQEDYIIGNLSYGIELLKVKNVQEYKFGFDNLDLLDNYFDNTIFSFPPNSKREINFFYQLPQDLPSGNYVIRVFIKNPELFPLAWQWYDLGEIQGTIAEFVFFEDAWVISDKGEKYGIHDGVPVPQSSSPQFQAKVYNNSGSSIDAGYQIKIYKPISWGELIKEEEELLFTVLAPLSVTDLVINLPAIEAPGIYWGEIIIVKDGKQISPLQDFHWVVSGETGRIVFAGINNDSFKVGEEIQLNVSLADKPELHLAEDDVSSLGDIDLRVQIICQDGGEIADKTFVLNPRDQSEFNLDILANKTGNECGSILTMSKNNKILHSYQIAPEGIDLVKSQEITHKPIKETNNYLLYLIIIIALSVSVYLGMKYYNRNKSALLIFLIIIGGVVYAFVPQLVQAGPCINPTVTWNNPVPNSFYENGDNILVDGSFYINYCLDHPADLMVRVLLDGDSVHTQSFGGIGRGNRTRYFSTVLSDVSPGSHNVTLWWDQDCTRQGTGHNIGSISRTIRINESPVTSTSCNPSSCQGYAGVPRGFDGSLDIISSATDPDNSIQSCNFQINGSTKSTNCSNTYLVTGQGVGTHTASMTATDTQSLTSVSSISFEIKRDIAANFNCSLDNITFQDCASLKSILNQTVYFQDTTTPSTGAITNNWSWTFQNATPTTSTDQNTNAKFTESGINTVTLTATDSQGRSDIISQSINVKSRLKPSWKEWISW